MKKITKLSIGQGGDTIVEVLLAIAIASSVLGIAFATSSRNLRATRDVQEHAEATRLIQGQIEALRHTYYANPSSIPDTTNPFCMNGSTVVPGACTSGLYTHTIKRHAAGSGKFYLTANWDSLITPTAKGEVTMVYKLN